MSLALLFPGQGTQHPAMLPWLDAQPDAAAGLARLATAIGPDWRRRLDDAAWLATNRIAQALLTGVELAAWRCLAGRLPAPGVVAGYSVGELAAFAAAGVIEDGTALVLAEARAQAMSDSAPGATTGLLAVQGHGAQASADADAALDVAIRIARDRVIVGGASADLEVASERWVGAGLRTTRLPIQIASHTRWMRPAVAAFAARLEGLPFGSPTAAVVCNFTASVQRRPADLKRALAQQLATGVRWDDCMDAIAERRPGCVLEIGPGSSLAAMWRERHPAIPVRSIDEFRDVDGVVRWAIGHGA